MLDILNLTYRRFSAVDGIEFLKNQTYADRYSFLRQTRIIYSRETLSPGQIGCLLSYLALLKEIADSNTRLPVLVLEDDVDLQVDLLKTILTTIPTLQPEWDILLGGYCCLTKYRSRNLAELGPNPTHRVKKFATTHCQVFHNSTIAKKIYQKLNQMKLDKPIDMVLHDLTFSKFLNVFALQYQIAIQQRDLFKSDIEKSIGYSKIRLRSSLRNLISQT